MQTGDSLKEKKRFRSKKNIAEIKKLPCLVCGLEPSDPAHLRSRGAGGGDELWNLIPLCRPHHSEQHAIGLKSFVEKYDLPISWDSGWPRVIDKSLRD